MSLIPKPPPAPGATAFLPPPGRPSVLAFSPAADRRAGASLAVRKEGERTRSPEEPTPDHPASAHQPVSLRLRQHPALHIGKQLCSDRRSTSASRRSAASPPLRHNVFHGALKST
uniref:Uncharacterized protein n=1 Tax=Aegilops tauschii TaxID=37682 RepID=M8C9A4_AEGTA